MVRAGLSLRYNNRDMKIAFDIRGIDGARGGKGIWTANVLKSMMRSDHENEYVLYTNRDYPEKPPYNNVSIRYLNGKGLWWHWKLYRQMLKDKVGCFMATESYVIPFLHNPRKLNVGLVVHDLVVFKSPARHQKRATWIEKVTLRGAAKKSRWIFTVSRYTRKDLLSRFPKMNLDEKTHVVYAGVRDIFDVPAERNRIISVQRRYNLEPDYLMMAGTLEPRKNILGAIKAYSLLHPKHRQTYRFVIVGKKGWYYEQIFEKVKELDLLLRVKFLEYIPDDDLVTLMQGAKLFLFPSFYEGFGLPVLEAMRCGVPVLASRVTSIPELGVDAIHYADPTDPVDIADGITQLLENEEYRLELREKGFEQVKHFSWDKTAKLILDALNEARGSSHKKKVA
jgi:glycosyltransferase involved in cell wall biosynthesis